jgi:hypothetical protein
MLLNKKVSDSLESLLSQQIQNKAQRREVAITNYSDAVNRQIQNDYPEKSSSFYNMYKFG